MLEARFRSSSEQAVCCVLLGEIMSPLATSAIVFACIFGVALLAMFFKRFLPENHLSAESKDVVKMGMGTMATLAAIILGLLIATAKGTYDAQSGAIQEYAAKVMLLDRLLEKYGPETKDARELLRGAVESTVTRFWADEGAQPANLAPGEARAAGEAMYDKIGDLSPQNDAQRALKARAMQTIVDLTQERIRLFVRHDGSLPLPFLVVLASWLVILFAGYGLVAPPNATVVAVLFLCTLSVSAAIFMLLELSTPFSGMLRISSGPLRDALSLIGK
jgi:uncharacterized membrane protein (DUF485 family)